MAFALALKKSGKAPDEAMEILVDSGVDLQLATQIVTELFPEPSRKPRRQTITGRVPGSKTKKPTSPKQQVLDRVKSWLGYEDCVGHNKAGYVLIGLGFGLAFLICWLGGAVSNQRLLLIGGPITTVLDLSYRRYSAGGHWLRPDRGGRFLLLPVWVFGLIWLAFGAFEITGPEK
jgi:hypothetical protein